jgi:predicted DNA-binding transcriptional regulator YafY
VSRRSQTETVAGVYQAFLARRTWKQADLARELGVSSEAVRRVLLELLEKGMPLESETDRPHVYWSVRRNWFPGSVLFKQEEVPELLRQLRRIPHGQGRARLLSLVLDRLPPAPGEPAVGSASPIVVPQEASPEEERHLSVIEDAASRRASLHMRYLTAGRVDEGTRYASVHRVLLGPPTRFIATCHRDGKLKTFRADSVLDARLDPREPFRPADDGAVDAYLKESLDGFHEEGPATTHSFLVRAPDARWVKKNLVHGMVFERAGDGIRVTVTTSALTVVARFVVGLGAAATSETPALARAVAVLARGALEAIEAGERSRSPV